MEDVMEEEVGVGRQYMIDVDAAEERGRSMTAVIAARRCFACRQADGEGPISETDAKEHIGQISQQCADTPDYLLPDTPIKEAIFRVLVAGGNEPMTAEEISESLSGKWAMSAYPRDVSPRVIGRLLDHSQRYSIAALPEPEPEPEESVEASVEGPVAVEAGEGPTEEGLDKAAASAGNGVSLPAEEPPDVDGTGPPEAQGDGLEESTL